MSTQTQRISSFVFEVFQSDINERVEFNSRCFSFILSSIFVSFIYSFVVRFFRVLLNHLLSSRSGLCLGLLLFSSVFLENEHTKKENTNTHPKILFTRGEMLTRIQHSEMERFNSYFGLGDACNRFSVIDHAHCTFTEISFSNILFLVVVVIVTFAYAYFVQPFSLFLRSVFCYCIIYRSFS